MVSSGSKRSGSQVAMPPPVARALSNLGHDLSMARRMRRLTQEDLAQRIGTSLSTVRRMEDGYPGTALHTFLRALHVLGRLEEMVRVMALEQDTLGLELARDQLPQRVRATGGKKPKARPSEESGREGGATGGDELEGF